MSSTKFLSTKVSAVFACTAIFCAMLMFVVCDGNGNPSNNSVHTHSWGDWQVTTPATCDAAGVETRICKEDASHTETSPIEKLTGAQCETEHTHTWGEWTVTTPATCDAAGVETRTCQTDNSHTETSAIPQLSDSEY